MKTLSITLDYLPIEGCLDLVDSPNKEACQKILVENRALFEKARGSTHNHQAWDGGYIDHVADGLNYARHLYELDAALGRPMKFSRSDALLIYFLHDLEKPWRIVVDKDGNARNKDGLDSKEAFKKFREKKLASYAIVLTPAQQNALTYVEGELKDYSSEHRVMNELAAFCHKVDVWSARQCYDYPKQVDEWDGARRRRVIS